jgi:glycosyltransferase involved in cell wall biosynthesis
MADPSTQPQPWYSRVEYSLARRLYPTADYVVAVSRGAADALAGRLRLCAESINVIYNPVLTPELRQRAAYDPNHPWLQASSPPVIVAAGRFDEPKDFVTLIAAFGMLRQRRNARLLILGEGPTRPRLETLVKQLGLESDVQMPGFQANPYPFIAAARLFVLSSRSEALPTVVVEALYLGTPVIATDCPGGVREILQDGRYGRLIPVANEESMADSMEELLSQHPGIQPEESWRRFTVDAATDAYVRLLFGPSAGEMTGSLQQDYVRNHESN